LIVILLAATRLVGTDNGGEDADAVTGLITTCYVLLALAFGVAGTLAVRGKLDLGEKADQAADEIPGSADRMVDGDKAVEVSPPLPPAEVYETKGGKAADGDQNGDEAEGSNEAVLEVSGQV
jgi:hypothetical protein